MRCLADFVLGSDLCLAPGTGPLAFTGPQKSFAVTLSNAGHDPALPNSVLSARIVFDAPSFENIRAGALEKLADCLNFLTFVTNRKFALVRLKRIIDWTPGLLDRHALIFAEMPEWDVAEPALDQLFVDTVERLLLRLSGNEQQAAMRWYRLGVQAQASLEEQFSYFWFALEIAAETLKGTDKVNSKCPRCRSNLFCEQCDDYPTHRRYPGEAIQQVLQTVQPEGTDQIFEALQTIRHTLMHGGRISSIIDQLPCNAEQAVNKLAYITWHAIWMMFKPSEGEETLNFGYVDNIVRRTIVGTAHVVTQMLGGNPNDPHIKDFPNINFTAVPTSAYTQAPAPNMEAVPPSAAG
jgi:hypothetical protein